MQRLAPSNLVGTCITGQVGIMTIAGVAASTHAHAAVWLVGQAVLAVALLQWFVVIHEAGHLTLFASRRANLVAGHVAGFFALIPFESWRRVHGLHHRWTGWQDLDPTTASLVPRRLAPLERFLIDWAWRLWLPLFSTLYRLNNYWHLKRVSGFFRTPRARRAIAWNAFALGAGYVVLAAALGPAELLRFAGLAILLSLALQDPLILSQHTHVTQKVSGGRDVAPLPPEEQERYTRSLRFPGWVARWVLFHFDAHELHHSHAHVPGYRLHALGRPQANEVHWWAWLRGAKRLRGSVFLFSNRDATGFRL